MSNKHSGATRQSKSLVTEQFIRFQLHSALSTFRSEFEMARAIGVSRSHFNRVVRGEKPVSGKVLKWLGYREVRAYEEVK